MNRKTRLVTLVALLSAFTVIMLYIASVWPTGQLGMVALASLFVAAAVIETKLSSGMYVYVISSALGMLLLPNRAAPLLYIFFFGYYPIVKSLIERVNKVVLQWVLKILVFNVSLTAIWFLFGELIFNFGDNSPNIIILYIAGSAVFALFDYGYSKLIWLYINRISRHIN